MSVRVAVAVMVSVRVAVAVMVSVRVKPVHRSAERAVIAPSHDVGRWSDREGSGSIEHAQQRSSPHLMTSAHLRIIGPSPPRRGGRSPQGCVRHGGWACRRR